MADLLVLGQLYSGSTLNIEQGISKKEVVLLAEGEVLPRSYSVRSQGKKFMFLVSVALWLWIVYHVVVEFRKGRSGSLLYLQVGRTPLLYVGTLAEGEGLEPPRPEGRQFSRLLPYH
jgi:hypothetical protein